MAVKRYADVQVFPRPRKMMRIVLKSWSRFLPPYIPDDVIFNILSRLPSKSVIRFKSVCKAWHTVISDPHFINVHHERSKERTTILMVPGAYQKQKNDERIAFLMGIYKYHCGNVAELVHLEEFPEGIAPWTRPVCCNGLILFSTLNQEMIVCNPATRDLVTLPKGSPSIHRGPRVGFGFDPCSNKYKVAGFFYQRDATTSKLICRFEVLTLGTNVWRRTVDPDYPIAGLTPVHVQSAIYWITCSTSLYPDPPSAFLRFSLTDENFGLVPYPPCDVKPARFIELEGELCCACFFSGTLTLEIWTCSAGQNLVWTRRCTVGIPPDVVVKHPVAVERPPIVVFHGKMLLLIREHKVYQLNTETCNMEKVAAAVEDIRYYDPRNNKYRIYLQKEVVLHVINYAESLVLIRQLQK